MPIYEFQCPACQSTFEELVRSEAAIRDVACPKCGGRKITRVPSVFSAHAAAKPAARPGPCGGCCGGDGSCPMGHADR